jgi:mono/diheme cytochrome c family protein
MRKLLLTLISLAVVGFIAALIVAFVPTRTRAIAAGANAVPDAALVEKGRYLAVAGDCIACHTAPGGQPFAGGLPMASPIGTLYSSNITPDRETGIGGYSLDDFDRALRHGIVPSGATLYPAMPYPSYARLSDDDVQALYAYFMHGVEPVAAADRASDIRWPLSMRWPLAIWRKLFAPAPERLAANAPRYADPAIARGAYLVQGLEHCGSCHTPRAITLQEKALDESAADYLAGGQVIDGWGAVNLRGNQPDGLGAWSADAIVALLKSGHDDAHAVVGSAMGDVVIHSTQHLHDDDLKAIAAYLKSLPPSAASGAAFVANPATAKALQAGINANRGAELYVDNCAACHRSDGAGYAQVFPKIAGNSTALAGDATSLIRLILAGSGAPATASAPSHLGMPAFGWRLSDDEVAQLGTFVRQSWGNQAPGVDAATVRRVRGTLAAEGGKGPSAPAASGNSVAEH